MEISSTLWALWFGYGSLLHNMVGQNNWNRFLCVDQLAMI